MVEKKTGIPRELIIHPGETIADVLEERGISQVDLAVRTGVSAAYVCSVISGKKSISVKFAKALEYALGVSKTFWLNLQVNYDAELLDADEEKTITEEERVALESLDEVVSFLQEQERIPKNGNSNEIILFLRKALRISDISNLKNVITVGAFKDCLNLDSNPYVLGAWVRLCQIQGENRKVVGEYSKDSAQELIQQLKLIMMKKHTAIQEALRETFSKYGIIFSVAKSFKGAPINGYVSQNHDGSYLLIVTIRDLDSYEFWYALFHELGHIGNGDVNRNQKYIDDGYSEAKERAADAFARNNLLSEADYNLFLDENSYEIECINKFAKTQHILPYVVIGFLQNDKKIIPGKFQDCKPNYTWKAFQ